MTEEHLVAATIGMMITEEAGTARMDMTDVMIGLGVPEMIDCSPADPRQMIKPLLLCLPAAP